MRVKPLRRLVDPARPLTYGIVQAGDDVAGGVPYIRPSDMDGHEGVNLKTLRTTSTKIDEVYKRSRLAEDDVVVSIGPGYGKTMKINSDLVGANLTQGTARVAVAAGVDSDYIRWALRARTTTTFWDAEVAGAIFKALNLGPLGRTPIPWHDHSVQRNIAHYLNHETVKIDELIDNQQRLVETLRERRRVIIEHRVSRGLMAEVLLKSSNLRWIKSVPAHWRVGNIRRFAKMKTGHTPSRSVDAYWVDCKIPWVTLADVGQMRTGRESYISKNTTTQISALGLVNSAAELLPAGTVMLSRTASVGFCGIMPTAMATSQDYWNWICGIDLLPEYLILVFRAMHQEFRALMMGSTHKTIYQDTAASIAIPVPPLREQQDIVDRVGKETSAIDALIAKAEQFIALSRERRSALITAAVTGQIDVREMS